MIFETYADRDQLAINLANNLAGDIKNALLHHDTVSLAVPGGTTPGPIFDVLSAARLDWERVTVMATDERWVAPDNARSNAAMISERLLTGPAEAATIIPFYRAGLSVRDGAAAAAKAVQAHLPLSVLLLGMGEDGHVASLFPDAPDLAQALDPDAPAVVSQSPASQPETRLSLAAHVLNGALAKHLVIFGAAKRDALNAASTDTPVRRVASDLVVHWAL